MKLERIKNIGDYLDLEVEGIYLCSDGGETTCVSVDGVLDAQIAFDEKQVDEMCSKCTREDWYTKHPYLSENIEPDKELE